MITKKIELGAVAIDGEVLFNPVKPWGYEGRYVNDDGDIPSYRGGEISLVDSADINALISWVPVTHNDKQILIADRNLLKDISWQQLNEQGLISGKEITLGGKRYKLRVLTGGVEPLDGDYELGGYPTENEWDLFIANNRGKWELPEPKGDDFAEYVTEESLNGAHNQFWNWAYIYSWCQETRKDFGSFRVIRGYYSARYFNLNTSSNRNTNIGWRPALEVLEPENLSPGEKNYDDMTDSELQEEIQALETELRNRWVDRRVSELIDKGMHDVADKLKESLKRG